MAADKMKEIFKHFPDLEDGWKEMEEKLKAEPAEMEMLSLKYQEMLQRESSKDSLVKSEDTKAKMADSDLKVMEAKTPEKIYLHPTAKGTIGASWLTFPLTNEDIEYTRTDAFIKKACKWLMTHSEDDYFELIKDANYCGAGNLNKKRMIEDFKNYMKGELTMAAMKKTFEQECAEGNFEFNPNRSFEER